MNLDFNNLSRSLSAANSAMQAAAMAEEMERAQRIIAENNRQVAQRNETLVAGAEASIAQKELLEKQLEATQKQNALLCDNYEKLKELYDAQLQANIEAKDELMRSKRFNAWMMIIAIIAMFAAIAGPIATILVSR